jgi:hypothetical protein
VGGKAMKKSVLHLLIFAIMLTSLCACGEESTSELSYTDFSDTEFSYENTSFFLPPDTSENTSQNESSGEVDGFTVKDKKYQYKDKDLVIIEVQNDTSRNYSVTISGTYYDQKGAILKTETHSFDGFAAGYRNYFLFAPNLTFSNFSYAFSATEYSGECYAQNLSYSLSNLREERWPIYQVTGDHTTPYPMITARLRYTNKNTENVTVATLSIIIDENDQIFSIETNGTVDIPPNAYAESTLTPYYEITEGELSWPKALQDKLTKMVILLAASKDPGNVPIPKSVYPQFEPFV